MTFSLPDLPYESHALEPVISSATLKLHHGAHHRGYVDKLNRLVKGTELEGRTLEDIVRRSSGTVFNNAAQAWNHAFFWQSLAPAREPAAHRGSLSARFAGELKTAAAGFFGSGWIWLVEERGALSVTATVNADNPLRRGLNPLLVIDLWEHAYYLDHQNRRDVYVDGVVDRLLNWEFAEQNLAKAPAHAAS
jgi:Fe-Mn family superoxide dismutase